MRPQPGDLVGGWFDDRTVDKLTAAGIVSLSEFQARIAHHLSTLLPGAQRASQPLFALVALSL
jgi:hypothetical protein